MTPLPKKRHSSERQGRRRAALSVAPISLVKCDNCGNLKVPHRVCQNCGTYDGVVVTTPKVKTKVTKVEQEK